MQYKLLIVEDSERPAQNWNDAAKEAGCWDVTIRMFHSRDECVSILLQAADDNYFDVTILDNMLHGGKDLVCGMASLEMAEQTEGFQIKSLGQIVIASAKGKAYASEQERDYSNRFFKVHPTIISRASGAVKNNCRKVLADLKELLDENSVQPR